jgi:MFS family permease
MGYGLSFWPIPVFAAIQSQVAAEFGTPNRYIWFIPAWSLGITVSFLVLGANTDLFGRRWFLVGGNIICFIGHLVVATSKSADSVIAGMAVAGFGGANCQMAAFALSELLPNKWRHLGVVFADLATLVAVIVGPVTARFGFEGGTWRWNFYGAAIFQAISFLGLYLLYFPPAHPNGLPYGRALREMDYIGKFFRLSTNYYLLLTTACCRNGSVHCRSYSVPDGYCLHHHLSVKRFACNCILGSWRSLPHHLRTMGEPWPSMGLDKTPPHSDSSFHLWKWKRSHGTMCSSRYHQ